MGNDRKGGSPLAAGAHGASTRRPVYSGNRRVPGLYERTLADGSTVYDVAFWRNGGVVRHRLEARTKTDAIAELRTLRVDYERGELHRSTQLSPTLFELADDYVAHLRDRIGDPSPKQRRSPRTVADARYKLDRYILPVLGNVRAAELTVSDVLRLLDSLAAYRSSRRPKQTRLSPNTRTGILSTLSGLVRYGAKRGLIERNIVRDVDRDDRPGTRRLSEPRYLDEEELGRLLDKLGETFRPIAAVYVYTGLRASEALGLRWRDLDLTASTLQVEHQLGKDGKLHPLKTDASRVPLRILPALHRELTAHRQRQAQRNIALVQPDALVFTTASGRPQSARNVLRAVHRAGDRAGLNDSRERVGLHDLRHTLIGLAFEHGLTLPEASVLARHANPRVTAQVYAGLPEKTRERVAAKLAESGFGA
jgi:integrase